VDEAAVAASVEALANRWETAEAAEGIAAFFAKRTPPWQSG
jgi:methylglutaconyl-CoA hydratase